MSYEIIFWNDSKRIKGVVEKWKKSNPKLYKKLKTILEDIALHPHTGLGHPESLASGDGTIYSRSISAHDRIIYQIREEENTIYIMKLEGHYDDK